MRCTQWPTSKFGIRQLVLRLEALGLHRPRPAAVVGAEHARGRDRDVHALVACRVDEDRVQAHAAGARLPLVGRRPLAQARHLLPGLARVLRDEQRRVLDAGVHRVGVAERGLDVPHALERPRLRRAVVEQVRAGIAVVGEFIADGLPRPAAVVRTLHELPEPTARLRGVDAVGHHRRALQVVHLEAREVGALHRPVLALAVGGEDEGALLGADEDSNSTHVPCSFHAVERDPVRPGRRREGGPGSGHQVSPPPGGGQAPNMRRSSAICPK